MLLCLNKIFQNLAALFFSHVYLVPELVPTSVDHVWTDETPVATMLRGYVIGLTMLTY